MKKINILIISLFVLSFNLNAQIKLNYEENKSVTYDETIEYYKQLDDKYKSAKLIRKGKTDIGRSLHLFVISEDADFDPGSIRKKDKRIILINNGIHPGEPCGVDGSILFAQTVLSDKKYTKYLKNTVICIIPVYNIGGTLNRSKYWRPQQPGPEECGFRGNAKNLDLNRDFVKLDTKNAKSFTDIFHEWQPDIFLDTHTTNGSDHKYAITLITTQKDQYDADLGDFVKDTYEKTLFDDMKKTDHEMIPYINWIHSDPEKGITEYIPSGNHSSGYGRLFNTISFMTENHVYKSFKDRVESVYDFELILLKNTSKYSKEIKAFREKAKQQAKDKKEFVLRWETDSTKVDQFEFAGYKRVLKKNKVTGLLWREYDHDSVFTLDIPFYRYYKAELIVEKPYMYIIPQAWDQAIQNMKRNQVNMCRLTKDTVLEVALYYIENNQKAKRQYNGHIVNENFKLRNETMKIKYYKGDYLIPVDQDKNNYIVETLEPNASPSFFRWNFFDPILERREYLTYNGFEDEAIEYLKEHPELKQELDKKIKEDEQFAKNHYAQMWFIFQNSPYYEKTHNRYPVARINKTIKLPVCEE